MESWKNYKKYKIIPERIGDLTPIILSYLIEKKSKK